MTPPASSTRRRPTRVRRCPGAQPLRRPIEPASRWLGVLLLCAACGLLLLGSRSAAAPAAPPGVTCPGAPAEIVEQAAALIEDGACAEGLALLQSVVDGRSAAPAPSPGGASMPTVPADGAPASPAPPAPAAANPEPGPCPSGPGAAQPPHATLRSRLAVLTGLAYACLNDPARAVAHFERAARPPLPDWLALQRGRALLQLGRLRQATAAFDAARKSLRSPWRTEADVEHALALAAGGRLGAARGRLTDVLARYPEWPARARGWLALGQLAARAGKARVAAQHFRAAGASPGDPAAVAEAAAALQSLPRAVQRIGERPLPYSEALERLRGLIFEKRWTTAEAALDALERQHCPDAARCREIRTQRARMLMRRGQFAEAADVLEPLIAAAPRSDADLALLRAEALERAGRADEAVLALRRLAGRIGAATLESRLLDVYLSAGRHADADALLAPSRPPPPRNLARGWQLAWLDFRLGRHDVAAAAFRRIAERSATRRPRALYWAARCDLEAGRRDEALDAFRAVAAAHPASFYGALAESRLYDLGAPSPAYAAASERIEVVRTRAGGGVCRPSREIGARDALSDPRPALPDALAASVTASEWLPSLQRVAGALSLGLRNLARQELRFALAEWYAARREQNNLSRLVGRPLSPFLDRRETPRGVWGEDLEAHRPARMTRAEQNAERLRLRRLLRAPRTFFEALRVVARAVDDAHTLRVVTFRLGGYASGVPTAENAAYWRAAYPLSWATPLLAETALQGLSPSYVWGLMTVESAHNETAHSTANARGLMQLLPRTARLMAERLGDPEPLPAQLLDPRLNLRYGVNYLAALVAHFDGQHAFALAAYNAGPQRMDWQVRLKAGQPFDVVLEELPDWAGREYAKKVLQNEMLYRRIYVADPVLYIAQGVTAPRTDGLDF